ncbi:MAG TPA: response regulator [Myxococcota bacterium]|nr:response regulator [Myxococcota bacterium]
MKTVLIVDDEHGIVDALTEVLRDEGLHVVSAANGLLGLQKLAHARVDAVILDLMMPILDGKAMLHRMRASTAHAATPVILMSAVPEAVAFAAVNQPRPYDAFLRKPFDLEELLAILTALLDAAR